MNPTFRSFARTANTTANPHLASKPAGLAVGDRIVLMTMSAGGFTSGDPSGFTKHDQSNGDAGSDHGVTVYSKIADAADVAGSSFSIANAASQNVESATWAAYGDTAIRFVDSGSASHEFADCTSGTYKELAVGFTGTLPTLLIAGFAVHSGYAASWINDHVAGTWPESGGPSNEPTLDFTASDWYFYAGTHMTWPAGLALNWLGVQMGAPQVGNIGLVILGAPFETAIVWTGSLAINGGAPSTLDPNVTLALAAHSSAGAVADMAFSADGTTWSAWESFAGTRAYTLPAQTAYPTEAKTVYARFRDSGGNVSPTCSDSINLTTEVPPIADFVIAPVQKVVVMCTLWLDDIFVRELHLTGGSVTADSRRSRTRDATIEVAPDDELTHRELYDLLTTPGLEIQLARGFYDLQCAQGEAERERAPGNTVLAALGRFVIDTLSYKRSGSGTTLSVSCSDLSARISRARWTDPYQVIAGTGLVTALVELLRDCWPDVRFAFDASAVPDTIDAAAVFDVGEGSDPWADAANLAAAHGYLLLFDETGRAALAALPDLAQASPVFTFARGATAIMTEQERSSPLENVYNGVIVTGEGSGVETPVRGEAWDDDPGSPGYRWGPLGPAPMFYSSPLITTTDQAVQAAASLLAGVIGRAEALSWSSVVHPGLLPLNVIAMELEDGTTRDYIIDQLTIPLGVGETMSAVAREVRMPW